MVFQDALSALNPVFPVGWQIAEMFRKHRGMNKSDSQAQAIRLMQRVQIPGAAQRVKAYPHQFSGGGPPRSSPGDFSRNSAPHHR